MTQHEIVEGPDYGPIDERIKELYDRHTPKEISEIIGLDEVRVRRRISILHKHGRIRYKEPDSTTPKNRWIAKASPVLTAVIFCPYCNKRRKAMDCMITEKGLVKCPVCGNVHLKVVIEAVPAIDEAQVKEAAP